MNHTCLRYFSCSQKLWVAVKYTGIGLTEKQKELMAKSLPKKTAIPGVKQTVLIASGKGGVGKSTTAVNLAVALAAEDNTRTVGLLDADVFGPSIPRMMNLDGAPHLTQSNLMIPLTNFGVKCMSMGFLVRDEDPVVWRGLMVMSAIQRLLREVSWGPLDCLLIDMPPGTGDTQLSITQNIPIHGAVMVTTPQNVAVQGARKGARMFQKVGIPLLGIIQNMSRFSCPHCHGQTSVFGEGGAEKLAQELGISVIGDIPLDPQIMEGCDSGRPAVISHPDRPQAEEYRRVAKTIAAKLSEVG